MTPTDKVELGLSITAMVGMAILFWQGAKRGSPVAILTAAVGYLIITGVSGHRWLVGPALGLAILALIVLGVVATRTETEVRWVPKAIAVVTLGLVAAIPYTPSNFKEVDSASVATNSGNGDLGGFHFTGSHGTPDKPLTDPADPGVPPVLGKVESWEELVAIATTTAKWYPDCFARVTGHPWSEALDAATKEKEGWNVQLTFYSNTTAMAGNQALVADGLTPDPDVLTLNGFINTHGDGTAGNPVAQGCTTFFDSRSQARLALTLPGKDKETAGTPVVLVHCGNPIRIPAKVTPTPTPTPVAMTTPTPKPPKCGPGTGAPTLPECGTSGSGPDQQPVYSPPAGTTGYKPGGAEQTVAQQSQPPGSSGTPAGTDSGSSSNSGGSSTGGDNGDSSGGSSGISNSPSPAPDPTPVPPSDPCMGNPDACG